MADKRNWSIVKLMALMGVGGFMVGVNAGMSIVDRAIGSSGDGFARGFLSACGQPCVVRDNPGGKIVDFESLARAVKKQGVDVIVMGECASACALFADRARDRVRVTPYATFAFHRTNLETTPPDSPDLVEWVEAHGGFPSNAGGNLTVMRYPETTRYWSQMPMVTPKAGAVITWSGRN